jgi:aspartyl protease family protein
LETKRLGRGMLVVAWLGVLALLTWLFDGEIARQLNPNPSPQGALGADGTLEVVLQRNARGHYVAGGRINGRPVEFLLDTGATDVAVPLALAERLGLPRLGTGMSRTANGVVQTWRSRLDRVSVGPIELADVRASVLPGMAGDDHVLLGMSFLKRLELEQRGDTLTLRQPVN